MSYPKYFQTKREYLLGIRGVLAELLVIYLTRLVYNSDSVEPALASGREFSLSLREGNLMYSLNFWADAGLVSNSEYMEIWQDVIGDWGTDIGRQAFERWH